MCAHVCVFGLCGACVSCVCVVWCVCGVCMYVCMRVCRSLQWTCKTFRWTTSHHVHPGNMSVQHYGSLCTCAHHVLADGRISGVYLACVMVNF